ncbi:tetratricopeptide repeat protein [Desulfonatronum thioautotrophicum]|uniref:tetratricopeptide repeat protein n=1 Tax=Desulfonatronum thioautotrophicum TaxID=617001 RepID=UPI00069A61DE|nr:hypothetical protein [Desulfonatronum thioautotrophicum]
MTEKIAWLEEVLRLEPNSKLFFSLAQAYLREQRALDAVATLRKGLAFHPEHLEARLLLIDCLSHPEISVAEEQESRQGPPPELVSLIASLSSHPRFWRTWADTCREQGRADLAVTLDLLAIQVSDGPVSWGSLLEEGLRAVTGQLPKGRVATGWISEAAHPATPPMPTEASPPASPPVSPPVSPPDTLAADDADPLTSLASAPQSPPDVAPGTAFEAPSHDSLAPEQEQEPPSDSGLSPVDQYDPEVVDEWTTEPSDAIQSTPLDVPEPQAEVIPAAPQAAQAVEGATDPVSLEEQLTEGERHYYETKTYADLLAKQGEHDEALDLYAKLLQTSPDDEQRQDIRTRIAELQERIAGKIREESTLQEPNPDEPGSTPGQTASTTGESVTSSPQRPAAKTTSTKKTLQKLAQRLESRAGH